MASGGWWDAIRLRTQALFRRRRAEEELEEELQFHIEHQTEEFVAQGIAPDRARTLALARIGGLESQKEQCRDARGVNAIDHVSHDVRGAARLLVRQPGFTAMAVLSLALGIGANATIFQLLDALKLRQLPVTDPGSLVRIDIANRQWVGDNYSGRYASFTFPLWEVLTAHREPFADLLAWNHATIDLSRGGESRFVENGLYVSGGFFRMLGVGAAAGRVLDAADDSAGNCTHGVVLSHAFWTREYGGAGSAIGGTLTLNGQPFTIVGVSAAGFVGVEVGRSFDLAMPLCAESLVNSGSDRRTNAAHWWLGVMGRLKPGWSRDRASAYLAAVSPAMFSATLPKQFRAEDAGIYRGFTLAALPGAAGFSQLRELYDDSLWILLVIVGVVLLIACANLANLQLARMSAREREMAIRLAIGASRGRLIQQLLCESLMLAALGTIAGAWLAPSMSQVIVGFISSDVDPMFIDLTTDWRLVGFLALMAVVTTVLFGLTPALRAAGVTPGSVTQAGRGIVGSGSLAMRRSLVVVQVALSVVLMTAGLLFARSLFNLLTLDAGFSPAGLLEADVDMRPVNLSGPARAALRDELLSRLRASPEVVHAATVASVPFVGNWWRNVYLRNGDGFARAMGRFNRVSAGYFATVGTPVLHGRDFDPRTDTGGSPRVAIVNEAFARKFLADGSPLGIELRPEGARGGEPGATAFRIVGVVGNTKHGGLREPFDPIVFVAESQLGEPPPFLNIFIRPRATPEATYAGVRATIAQLNPSLAFHFHDVGQVRLESISQDRLLAMLCGAFAILGAILATIGVYGVMAYSVARRRNELGIRLALGADHTQILRMVLGEATRVVGIGVAIGGAVALASSRLAASHLYGLEPSDPLTLTTAIVTLFGVALAAAFLPAQRASRMDPTAALRHD
jgi:predicted permease